MRWPFSLLFPGDRDAPAAADGRAGGSGAPAGGEANVPAAPPRPAAWRGMAPVQRTVGSAPLTAPAGPFARALASRRRPDPILRPLAHDVAADGPAGLVSGIAAPLVTPVSAAAAHAEAATLPVAADAVQRRSRTVSVAQLSLGGANAVGDDSGGGGAASALPGPLVRKLPVAGTAGNALAATRVAVTTAPEPSRPRARPAGVTAQRRAEAADGPADAPGASSGTVAAPMADPAGALSVQGSAGPPPGATGTAPVADAAVQAEGDAPAVQRRTLGESRRLGLGAPLARRPESRQAPQAATLPLARPPAPAMPPTRVASAAPASLPILRLAAPPAAPGSPASVPGADAAGSPPADGAGPGVASDRDAEAPTAPAAPSTRPLLGDPARRAGTPSGEGPGDHDDGAGGPATDAGPLPVARLATDSGPSTPATRAPGGEIGGPGGEGAPSLAATARPSATAPLVATRAAADARTPLRSTVASPPPAAPVVVARRAAGPAVSGPEPSVRSGEGRPPGVPLGRATAPEGRLLGATVPGASLQRSAADRASGPAWTAGRGDGRAVPAAGPPLVVSRSSGSLSAPGGTPPGSAAAARGGPPSPGGGIDLPLPVVSRLAADAASTAPAPGTALGWTPAGGFAPAAADVGPVIQRVVEIGEVSAEVGQGSPASDGGPGAGGGAGTPDYEEIAEHVYDRIRSRIALELLLDRERMGLLIDG